MSIKHGISIKHNFSVKIFLCIVSVVLIQSCGGGSSAPSQPISSTVSKSLESNSSSIANLSSNSSSTNLSSDGFSSIASSVPADFPAGTVRVLPVLALNTENAAPIVSKDDYVTGSFTLSGADGESATGTLSVRGRGNSTWDWPKKPYRVKLNNSTSLLGMPKNKNWVLLANYADKTLMRNDIAFMFSRSLGMEWTPRAQYVELMLNGAYQGVYQLVEQIRIDDDRVNIDEMKVTDVDADKITGGYLMEVDFRHNKDYCITSGWDSVCMNGVNTSRDVDYCVDSAHGMEPACLSNPDTLHDPAWSAQRDYIQQYYTDMEAALFDSNFTDPTTGYAAYLDVDSVVNYYIINELFKNVDGAVSSFYIYKKRGGKLFFGPIWDFDLSMGNAGYDDNGKVDGWHIRPAAWFTRLFQDPAFQAKVKARWNSLKADGKIDYIFQYAQARATWLDAQQQKNYTIWSITDFDAWILHGTHGGTGTYSAEVQEMIRWQRARASWMDQQLNM